VFFSPFAPPPAGLRWPAVLTVHDLTPLTHPALHLPATVDYFTRTLVAGLGRVGRIVADSKATADAIADRSPGACEKTHVVPLGVDAHFGVRRQEATESTLRPLGLSHHAYVLYVGSIEPRKNLVRAIDAYADSTIRGAWPFVIAGSRRWGSDAVLDRADAPDIAGHVRFLDYVADDDLPALYSGARFFVYPSLAEGFGLPVLEAMACGTPVLTCSSSSLPEVVGEAALLADPDDTVALRDAMNRLAGDAALRDTLGARGIARARTFTWDRTACETMRLILAAAGGPAGEAGPPVTVRHRRHSRGPLRGRG